MIEPIPAIVLTCQRYLPLAEHMIDQYDALWPSHPFVFRLPDGEAARCELARRSPQRLELLPTDEGEGRGRFKAAVFGLLAGLEDSDWVLWCLDDKYVTHMKRNLVARVATHLRSLPETVDGLCLCRTRGLNRDKNLFVDETLRFQRKTWIRRRNYSQIWLHQFLRVQVLRTLFSGFPDVIEAAKDMDQLIVQTRLPDTQRIFVLDHNALVFGESTSRGLITRNCAASLRARGGVPAGFKVSNEEIVIGEMPSTVDRLRRALRRRLPC